MEMIEIIEATKPAIILAFSGDIVISFIATSIKIIIIINDTVDAKINIIISAGFQFFILYINTKTNPNF